MDFRDNDTGGTIVVDAPNLHIPKISPDSSMDDRINYVLYSEVNPSLASHGGMVSLIEVADDNVAILQFGGGCQGCGMVDLTLKSGVEKTLIERIPELTAVRDVTDHSNRENAYYNLAWIIHEPTGCERGSAGMCVALLCWRQKRSAR